MSEIKKIERRTVLKGAAWSVPVIAVAAATPLAAASTATAVNGFQVNGVCGLLGAVAPGFNIAAGSSPLPVGTQITITTGGVNVSLIGLGAQSGLATVAVGGTGTQIITLTQALPANTTLSARWLLNVSALSTVSATLSLPTGFVAGTGTKATGGLTNAVLVTCNAS